MAWTSSVYPVRSAARDTIEVRAKLTSPGSAGDLTKTYGPQIASVARTDTGKYTVTFVGSPDATLVEARGQAHAVTTGFPLLMNCIYSSYAVSSGTASVNIEFSENDGAAALADPVSAAHPIVDLVFVFARSV